MGCGTLTVVQGDDVQAVQELPLVLVDPLHVHIKHGGRVDFHPILLLQKGRELQFVFLQGKGQEVGGPGEGTVRITGSRARGSGVAGPEEPCCPEEHGTGRVRGGRDMGRHSSVLGGGAAEEGFKVLTEALTARSKDQRKVEQASTTWREKLMQRSPEYRPKGREDKGVCRRDQPSSTSGRGK